MYDKDKTFMHILNLCSGLSAKELTYLMKDIRKGKNRTEEEVE